MLRFNDLTIENPIPLLKSNNDSKTCLRLTLNIILDVVDEKLQLKNSKSDFEITRPDHTNINSNLPKAPNKNEI
jgi:hypothetical protein